MNVGAIREKLNEYIRIADEEKIRAMYVLLRNDIEDDKTWWQHENLLKELDAEYGNWKSGNSRGYTTDEVAEELAQLRAKREAK